MLESISWTNFLEAAAVASGCYYIALAVAVYRKQIIVFANDPKSFRAVKKNAIDQDGANKKKATPMAIIHDLSSVLDHAGYNADKAVLLEQIKDTLHKYKDADLPAFRVPIQDYIISKAEEICGVRITVQDLEAEA